MVQDVMILMRTNPFRGPTPSNGPRNGRAKNSLDFQGPQMHGGGGIYFICSLLTSPLYIICVQIHSCKKVVILLFKIRQQAASDTSFNQDLNTLNQGSKNSVNPVLNNVNLTLSSNQDTANREARQNKD